MASVSLDFIPPSEPNIVTMRIFESPVKEGPFVLIETITGADFGDYPDYITRWTTQEASAVDNWFQLDFIDDGGAVSARSNAIKGGTKSLVGRIVERAMQRSPGISEIVAAQVAEAVIEEVMGVDPYSIDPAGLGYRQLEGMTLLTVAFSLQTLSGSGGTEKYVAGLVSEEVSDTAGDVSQILKLAYRWLGISPSRVAQMQPIIVAGISSTELDQSRLLLSEIL